MSITSTLKALIGDANPVAGLLMTYWKPILCVLALLGAYAAGYYRESGNCAAAATALREKQEQAVIDRQVKVIAGERAAGTITTGVSHEYENQISIVDKRYAALDGLLNGVRPPAGSITIPVPAVPPTAAGRNGSTGNCGLAPRARRLEIERKLDEQAQRLIACQAWIAQQNQNMISH